jgi:dipeptidyl aminopeptidase/acylaminoacyl peptidase
VVLTEVREVPLYPVGRFSLLADGKRFIWLTDTDEWLHLYLYDIEGNLLRRLTEGPFPVLRLVEVDEEEGWVYFIAHGDRTRPDDTQLYRVGLEGSRLSQLTESPGQHDIRFSPSKKYFLESHSSLSRPPRVELRQADGRLLQTLAVADIESLKLLQWTPPEEFVVKAADGETDLYGVMYKPYDFDPKKRYPVIVSMHDPARKFERRGSWPQAIAQLGFVTFQVNVRRPWTSGARGSEFKRITYGNFGRHEIPDHVAVLRNLAKTRPYMDLSRVGVRGQSFGGYFAIRALLQAPDVYHVGIAVAPITDLYTHGNAQWLGSPEENKEEYEYASNLRLAGNLKGKLLLIHGTYDRFVPLSHTMKMVDALVRADKPYDLMILPEWGHWANETPQLENYRLEAYRRYFQEHLKP